MSTIRFANSSVSLTVEKGLLVSKTMLLDLIRQLHNRYTSSTSYSNYKLYARIYNTLNYEYLFEYLDKFISQQNLNSAIELTDRDNFIQLILGFYNASTNLLSAIENLEKEKSIEKEEVNIRVLAVHARQSFISAIDVFTKFDQTTEIMLEESMVNLVSAEKELSKYSEKIRYHIENRGVTDGFYSELHRLAELSIKIVDQLQLINEIIAACRNKIPTTTLLIYTRVTENAVQCGILAIQLFANNSIEITEGHIGILLGKLEDFVEEVANKLKRIRMDDVESIPNRLDWLNQGLQDTRILRTYRYILSALASFFRIHTTAYQQIDLTNLTHVDHVQLLITDKALFCQVNDEPSMGNEYILISQGMRDCFAKCIIIMGEAATILSNTSTAQTMTNILQDYFKKGALIDLFFAKIKLISIENTILIKNAVASLGSVEENRKMLDESVQRLQHLTESNRKQEFDLLVSLFNATNKIFEKSFVALSKNLNISNFKTNITICHTTLKANKRSFQTKCLVLKSKKTFQRLISKKKNGADESKPTLVDENQKLEFAETMQKLTSLAISMVSQVTIVECEAGTDTIIPSVSFALLKLDFDIISDIISLISHFLDDWTDDDFAKLNPHRGIIAAYCESLTIFDVQNEYKRLQQTEVSNLMLEWTNYFMELNKKTVHVTLLLTEMMTVFPEPRLDTCDDTTKKMYIRTLQILKK